MATFKIRHIGEQYNTPSTRFKTPPLASGADFLAGAPVVLGAGGRVDEIASSTADAILGFATADADSYDWQRDTHGFVEPRVPVALASEEFRGTLLGTFAESDVGTEYGLTKQSDGIWVVDKSSTTNTRVVITGYDELATSEDGELVEVADGDENVPVTFMVLPEYRQVN